MPSKHRAQNQRQKQQYAQKIGERRQQAREAYAANSEVHKQNAKAARFCVAYKNRERIRNRSRKRRSMTDDENSARHRVIDRECKKKSMTDEEKRAQHRAVDRESSKKSMAEEEKRARRRAVNRESEARRQKDETYRSKCIKAALNRQRCRLQNDTEFRTRHRQICYRKQLQRLQDDADFKQRNKQNAYNIQLRRLQCDADFRNRNRKKATERSKRLSGDECNRLYKTQWMRSKRLLSVKPEQKKRRALSREQMYWVQRRRRVAAAQQMKANWMMRRKMCLTSNVSELDVQMLFTKAQKTIKKAELKARLQHQKLAVSAEQCLEHFIDDKVSEESVDAAYGGVRYHNYSTEPYYWEQAYHVLCDIDIAALSVDDSGRVHVFDAVVAEQQQNENTADNRLDEEERRPSVKSVWQWQCNAAVCRVTDDLVTGLIALLHHIVDTRPADVCTAYVTFDSCVFAVNSGKLGHMANCSPECGCDNSMLSAARALSCHYPQLRSQIRRLYEVRSIALHVKDVKQALAGGDFKALTDKTTALKRLLASLFPSRSKDKHTVESVSSTVVSDDDVMTKHGNALRAVCKVRDNYVTRCCDLCEQLRKDILPLASYEGRKGFTSEKLQTAIEMLYQYKTKYEDVDMFLQTTFICSYCADKLRHNKEVARSVFNCLAVESTPDCIKQLNIFEKVLIKFTMTCQVIVRLGQVSSKKRPQNELMPALKGRIVYLPVNVKANAEFLPDDLLNVSNLTILVGGQPTKHNRIWASAVDISKVHTALAWLRQNNHLYKDVPAYTVEQIRQIVAARQQEDGEGELSTDDALLRRLDEATRSSLYETFTVQPLNADYPQDAAIDYQLRKVSGQSNDIFDTDMDLKAFPELFPTGKFGLRDVTRATRISNSDYIKSRLLNKDPKFRLNMSYVFFCFEMQEVSNMAHSVAHMLRTVTGNSLSAREFADRLNSREGEIGNKMFSLMANIRGSKEYFAKLSMNIRWMIKRLGPPTLFITCSCAEWQSEPFISYLRTVNQSLPNVDNMSAAELCMADPVNVSIHFHKKWQAIFKQLILAKENPVFGRVADYFWRIEYQARGAPHVHCVLWVDDAPILGRDPPEKVKQYIDSVITCSKPDASDSPTLAGLVTKFQTHKCNKYCTKAYKRNGKFYRKCRFGFPRPVKSETCLNDVIDCLAVNKNRQPRKRLYHLQRTDDEVRTNDYNAALLLANEANVDVQYIGHLGSRLPYYITDYMTKHERSEQDDMWRDIFSSTKSLGTNAMSYLLKCVKSRQVGASEAADRLLGHKLYSSSRQMRFADLQPADKAKRVLKPVDDINNMLKVNPDCTNIFQPHWVLDVYPDRPQQLDSCSLHEFLSWYEREVCTGQKTNELKLKTLNYTLRRRTKTPYIVTHQVVNPEHSEEHRELYFYYLLKLFKPWRHESELCTPGYSYSDTYQLECDKLPDMVSYHNASVRLQQQDAQTEQAVKDRAQQLRQEQADADGDDVEDPDTALHGCVVDPLKTAMNDIQEANERTERGCDAESLQAAYAELNNDQRRVVDRVVSHLCDRHEDDALRLFVSGQGGTGKSRVIDVLHRTVCSKFASKSSVAVVVTAPTGLAAFNIAGSTIHRTFSLPVEHGKPADYRPLNAEQLTVIRATLRGLVLVIIDEVSMISSLTLLYIHLRLTEIMCNNNLFGGVSVVLFADLLQLSPVKGNQPFIPVTFLETKQRLGSVTSMDVWQTFQYDELTQNMRQNQDSQYAELLASVRVGMISDEHCALLEQRRIASGRRATVSEICQQYNQLVEDGMSPLILTPTLAQCSEINSAMLLQIGNPVQCLDAIDTLDTVVNKQLMPKIDAAYRKMNDDVTRTAGLEKRLSLCIGTRIMLKRNKDVDAGLVNGSIGTVVGFEEKSDTQINSIKIKFQTFQHPVDIQRESYSFEVVKSVYYTRRQFPIMLAFAITVHKAQGLSLQSAIVDIGSATFGSGMAYVALSRVTTLRGLHLIDFDYSKITCDHKAVSEYNRLRALYTSHLAQISVQQKTVKRKTDISAETQPQKKSKISVTKQKRNHKNAPGNSERATCSVENQITMSSENRAIQQNMFHFCDVETLDDDFRAHLCERLNLLRSPSVQQGRRHSVVASEVKRLIVLQSRTDVRVTVHDIQGDNNCLFRALSLGVTGTQDQHQLLRAYITNRMLDESVRGSLQQWFVDRHSTGEPYEQHVMKMQNDGEWGTDTEIIAAANLFQCSIICFSHVNPGCRSSPGVLQHFPPHFVDAMTCSTGCRHATMFLINESGTHYSLATVSFDDVEE